MAGAGSEHYKDPTANTAIGRVTVEERMERRAQVIRSATQLMARGAGFELLNRLTFRDLKSGREYR